jgi:hypothetical protein
VRPVLPPSVLYNDLAFLLALLQGELAKVIVRNKVALEGLLTALRTERQREREREMERFRVMSVIQKEWMRKGAEKERDDDDDFRLSMDNGRDEERVSPPLILPPPSLAGQLQEDVVVRQRCGARDYCVCFRVCPSE